jgi:hypothetical protein
MTDDITDKVGEPIEVEDDYEGIPEDRSVERDTGVAPGDEIDMTEDDDDAAS